MRERTERQELALKQMANAAANLQDQEAPPDPYSPERCAARVLLRLRDALMWGTTYLPVLDGELAELRKAIQNTGREG